MKTSLPLQNQLGQLGQLGQIAETLAAQGFTLFTYDK
jgi:hypothetical protein